MEELINILHRTDAAFSGRYKEEWSSMTKFEYNADYAQGKAEYEMTAKAAPVKLSKNMVLAEKIRDLIADKHGSQFLKNDMAI